MPVSHPRRNWVRSEFIDEGSALVQPAAGEDVARFAVSVAVQVLERHLVELEIPRDAIGARDRLRQARTHASTITQHRWYRSHPPRHLQAGNMTSALEEAPVQMLLGIQAGQNRRHAGRTVAEHR